MARVVNDTPRNNAWYAKYTDGELIGLRCPIDDRGDASVGDSPFAMFEEISWEAGSVNRCVIATYLAAGGVIDEEDLPNVGKMDLFTLLKYVDRSLLYGFQGDAEGRTPGDMMSFRAYPTMDVSRVTPDAAFMIQNMFSLENEFTVELDSKVAYVCDVPMGFGFDIEPGLIDNGVFDGVLGITIKTLDCLINLFGSSVLNIVVDFNNYLPVYGATDGIVKYSLPVKRNGDFKESTDPVNPPPAGSSQWVKLRGYFTKHQKVSGGVTEYTWSDLQYVEQVFQVFVGDATGFTPDNTTTDIISIDSNQMLLWDPTTGVFIPMPSTENFVAFDTLSANVTEDRGILFEYVDTIPQRTTIHRM